MRTFAFTIQVITFPLFKNNSMKYDYYKDSFCI